MKKITNLDLQARLAEINERNISDEIKLLRSISVIKKRYIRTAIITA